MASAPALVDYRQRIDRIEAQLADLQRKLAVNIALLVLAALTVAIGCFLAFSRRSMPAWCAPLPVPVALISLRNHRRQRAQISILVRLRRFYLAGVERLEERWAGNGISGEEFEMPGYPLCGRPEPLRTRFPLRTELAARGAIGALSTHDIALAEIAILAARTCIWAAAGLRESARFRL